MSENTDQIAEPKKYILIIEDDKFYDNIFQKKFLMAGYDLTIATDGLKGVEQAIQRKPDIILLDLIMPNQDGFETIQKLKANPGLQNVPIIVLSNLGQANDIEKAKQLGAVDYIVKASISLQEVVDKVTDYLSKK
jgi:CheY-like chemotaxis protein